MKAVVRLVAQALVLALLWSASVGHAQAPASAKARARELYGQGQQLFRNGEFGAAQRAFEDAYRAVPNPVVLLSVAECQVRIEDFAGALGSLKQYLAERPNAPDKTQVEAQITNLEAKPGYVAVESVPTGAQIALDGANTGQTTPSELPLRAGPHTIELTAPGHQAMQQMVEVTIGTRQRLTLTLTPEQAAVAETTQESGDAPVASRRGRRHAGAGVWTTLGIAGVAAITGTVLGVSALKKETEYNDGQARTPRVNDEALKKKGERMALFADVNFGIAAVAGVTALVLYLTSSQQEEPSEQAPRALRITPELSPHALGMQTSVRF